MFTREEAKEILDGEHISPFPSAEAKLFFSLSYCTGLSVETVRELKWENLNLDQGVVRTVETDEEDNEEVELSFDLALTGRFTGLQENSSDVDNKDYIFTGSDRGPLSMETIQKNFELTMEAAGINFRKRKLTPNSFRRTYNFWYA